MSRLYLLVNKKSINKVKKSMLDAMNDDKNDIITKQLFFSFQSLTDELLKFHNNQQMDKKRIETELRNIADKLNIMYGVNIFEVKS